MIWLHNTHQDSDVEVLGNDEGEAVDKRANERVNHNPLAKFRNAAKEKIQQ